MAPDMQGPNVTLEEEKRRFAKVILECFKSRVLQIFGAGLVPGWSLAPDGRPIGPEGARVSEAYLCDQAFRLYEMWSEGLREYPTEYHTRYLRIDSDTVVEVNLCHLDDEDGNWCNDLGTHQRWLGKKDGSRHVWVCAKHAKRTDDASPQTEVEGHPNLEGVLASARHRPKRKGPEPLGPI